MGDAAVGVQLDRHLGDARVAQARPDDHLGRELHPRAALAERLVVALPEAAQPAVDVVHRRAEPAPHEHREHRVAPPAVQEGHRAGEDRAAAGRQAAPLHERVAGAQLLDELRDLAEVVAVVGVAHDHPAAARRGDAAHERRAVATVLDRDDARTEPLGDLLGAVGAAVVGDDDLAGDAGLGQAAPRLLDAGRERVRLVEAGHHHRQLDLRLVARVGEAVGGLARLGAGVGLGGRQRTGEGGSRHVAIVGVVRAARRRLGRRRPPT